MLFLSFSPHFTSSSLTSSPTRDTRRRTDWFSPVLHSPSFSLFKKPVTEVGVYWHCFYWLTDNLLQFVIFLHVSTHTDILYRCKSVSVCFAKGFPSPFSFFSLSFSTITFFFFVYFYTFSYFRIQLLFIFVYMIFVLQKGQNTWFLFVNFFHNWSKVVVSSWDVSLR